MSSYSTSQDQMSVASTATASSAGAIPDILKIGTMDSNTQIEIETDVLDPVVGNESIIRFQLQNKGILHSHSKIVLRLDTGPNNDCHFPLSVGVHSLIQRCRLLVGTKTLSEIDDFNHYMGYKSLFMSGEHQKEREQLTSGRLIAHRIYYADGDNASNGGTSTTSASFLGIDNGYSASQNVSGINMDLGGDLVLQPYQCTSNSATIKGPEYQVALADLFPFLYTNQLPLYMMTEPVTIELFLQTGTAKRVVGQAGAFPLDHTATQMIADYQYFPQEIMEAYARANSTMDFSYVDYRLSKRTVSVVGAAGSEVATGETILNIGAAGRICSKVVSMISADAVTYDSMVGNFHSAGPMKDYASAKAVRFNGKLTANIKYNNKFLYPVDIDNTARLFYQVTQAEGMVPFVTREEYSNQGTTITPVELNGVEQNDTEDGLPSRFFYQAFHMNRAERVNSRGIEYYFNYDKLRNVGGGATTAYTLRSYVELLKTATLRDGIMTTEFA